MKFHKFVGIPQPILSVGYIAGFKEYERSGRSKKHLIVNGAINQGNSGGPLFRFDDNKVIGIVVNKHLPFTKFQLSAMEALANNPSGIQYAAVNDKGENVKFSESQLVVDLLEHFKSLSQVMIGEAIDVSELIGFLDECKLNQ